MLRSAHNGDVEEDVRRRGTMGEIVKNASTPATWQNLMLQTESREKIKRDNMMKQKSTSRIPPLVSHSPLTNPPIKPPLPNPNIHHPANHIQHPDTTTGSSSQLPHLPNREQKKGSTSTYLLIRGPHLISSRLVRKPGAWTD